MQYWSGHESYHIRDIGATPTTFKVRSVRIINVCGSAGMALSNEKNICYSSGFRKLGKMLQSIAELQHTQASVEVAILGDFFAYYAINARVVKVGILIVISYSFSFKKDLDTSISLFLHSIRYIYADCNIVIGNALKSYTYNNRVRNCKEEYHK